MKITRSTVKLEISERDFPTVFRSYLKSLQLFAILKTLRSLNARKAVIAAFPSELKRACNIKSSTESITTRQSKELNLSLKYSLKP